VSPRAAGDDSAARERDLLAQVGAGDEAALNQLYRRFEPRILAFAQQRLNDHAAACDILNEVMLEVWRSAKRFEGRSSVATWIFSITRYRLIDLLRRRGRQAADQIDEDLPAEGLVDAEQALAGAADAQQLRFCLERLPERQRDTLHLAFFEDLSYPEIARVMDCPEGTVKTRVYHAKQALKRCLTAVFHVGGADA